MSVSTVLFHGQNVRVASCWFIIYYITGITITHEPDLFYAPMILQSTCQIFICIEGRTDQRNAQISFSLINLLLLKLLRHVSATDWSHPQGV